MPRTNIDYSKSVIYMLKKKDDYDNENVYIGSTTDIVRRKTVHKSSCCNPNDKGYNHKKYQYIRENGGWENWSMILIEKYPCNNKLELEKREDEIMCEMQSKLNAQRASRNKKEYYEDNKEKAKEYYVENKEKLLEQKKEYRKNNKEKIAEKRKEYYEDNKDIILEKTKENYENNKEKILEKTKEKIECDKCKSIVSRNNLSTHKKTKKCLNYTS